MQCRCEQFDSPGDYYFLKGYVCLTLTQIITSSLNSWRQRLSHLYMGTYLISRCCKCVSICHIYAMPWLTSSFPLICGLSFVLSFRIKPCIRLSQNKRYELPDKWDDTVESQDKRQIKTRIKHHASVNLLRMRSALSADSFLVLSRWSLSLRESC